MDDDSPRDESWVFTGMDHLREPIKCGIRITASHRLDEGRDRVVVRILIPIVYHRLLLDTLLSDLHRYVNDTVLAGLRCQRSNFKRVQRLARIAVGDGCKVAKRIFICLTFQVAKPAFFVL